MKPYGGGCGGQIRGRRIAFEDTDQARTWFRAEHAVLTAAVEQSPASVPDALRMAVDLLILIAVYSLFPSHGHYDEACRLAGSTAHRQRKPADPSAGPGRCAPGPDSP